MYHRKLDVKAMLSKNSVEYASATVPFTNTGTKQLELKVNFNTYLLVHICYELDKMNDAKLMEILHFSRCIFYTCILRI